MRITFKLYASLWEYLPADRRQGNELALDVPEGSTIVQVMKLVHLVLVNGHFVPPEQRATRVLVEGDVLAIWPPVAGG